ncbi:MAG: class I SAM-dependent methyltransferase [Polyangiaceae bacterium]|nr:class I SAM-dependent methyltransferase [Polyangiaceae bacterium]
MYSLKDNVTEAPERAPTLYDRVPYESAPIVATSPENIALVSRLEGGPAPPLHGFSFLELGCGDASNLLALAFYRPHATFVGVDASCTHIEKGRAAAQKLGVHNVQLHVGDVRALGPEVGAPFDFIVSHGVFSWIPNKARIAMLEAIRDRLAPSGLGYVSYNAYPGWKLRGMVREIMLNAARDTEEPLARAEKARKAVTNLRELITENRHPYETLLATELEMAARCSLSYILHEYLSADNEAFYVRDFITLANDHGLRYVGDALSRGTERDPSPDLKKRLHAQELSDVETLQTIDLLSNRQFRASVLCGSKTPTKPRPGVEIVASLRASSSLSPPSGPPNFTPGVSETFRGGDDAEVRVSTSLTKAAFRVLGNAWPGSVHFDDLLAMSADMLRGHGVPAPDDGEIARLQRDLLLIHRTGQGSLRIIEPRLHIDPGPNPTAHALARHQVEEGILALTSPLHHHVTIDRFERALISGMDGTRPLQDLVLPLMLRVAAGDPPLSLGGERITDPLIVEPMVRGLLARAVGKLAQWGLLESPPAMGTPAREG